MDPFQKCGNASAREPQLENPSLWSVPDTVFYCGAHIHSEARVDAKKATNDRRPSKGTLRGGHRRRPVYGGHTVATERRPVSRSAHDRSRQEKERNCRSLYASLGCSRTAERHRATAERILCSMQIRPARHYRRCCRECYNEGVWNRVEKPDRRRSVVEKKWKTERPSLARPEGPVRTTIRIRTFAGFRQRSTNRSRG